MSPPAASADASTPSHSGKSPDLSWMRAQRQDAAMGATGSTGVLPPIMDPGEPGPFTPKETDNIGPDSNYTAIEPMELGQNEIKHPILVWSPGAGPAYPAIYQTLLNHIASHGFVISRTTHSAGSRAANRDRLDHVRKHAAGQPVLRQGGHQQNRGRRTVGGFARDIRDRDGSALTTTLHINGGTFDPHTDVMNLVKPALFICGDDPAVTGGDGTWESDLARPNCDIDFQMAMAPVWYGDVIGASHTTIIDDPTGGSAPDNPLKKPFLAATVAWMRWLLAGDETMKSLFVGADCGFCKDTSTWTVQQKICSERQNAGWPRHRAGSPRA